MDLLGVYKYEYQLYVEHFSDCAGKTRSTEWREQRGGTGATEAEMTSEDPRWMSEKHDVTRLVVFFLPEP